MGRHPRIPTGTVPQTQVLLCRYRDCNHVCELDYITRSAEYNQAYFMDGQHRRCLALLRGGGDGGDVGLLDDVRFQYLAAKCLAATGAWEECLGVLGGWDVPDPAPANEQARAAQCPVWYKNCQTLRHAGAPQN